MSYQALYRKYRSQRFDEMRLDLHLAILPCQFTGLEQTDSAGCEADQIAA